jgi:plasmid maintenance system antidote protein VapI
MSYELKISDKDRAVGRFTSAVRKTLFMAAFYKDGRKKITQQAIATRLGVNRSVINRMLRGGNMTLQSAAEIAWALGKTPKFILEDEHDVNVHKNWVSAAGSVDNKGQPAVQRAAQTASFGDTRLSNMPL